MEWTKDKEQELLRLRERGFTYKQIADQFETTLSAVKHKARRLMQNDNDDRYKHTEEKAAMFYNLMKSIDKRPLKILETHCGYGGMTGHYMEFGSVESYDIDKKRVEHINKYFWQGEIAFHADSEQEIYRLVYEKKKYDIVDIDPYGLPSRYFPHAFNLIDDGYMFVTFPMIGVAQMNKITIAHYKNFWDIDTSDKENYIERIMTKMNQYAFTCKRVVSLMACEKLDRVYRLLLKVEKKSMLDICDLNVKGKRE